MHLVNEVHYKGVRDHSQFLDDDMGRHTVAQSLPHHAEVHLLDWQASSEGSCDEAGLCCTKLRCQTSGMLEATSAFVDRLRRHLQQLH